MGPLLQPDIHEKQTSLDRIELTDEFLQGVRNCGCLAVGRGPGAVAVVIKRYRRPSGSSGIAFSAK